jgi:hypothetical protein
MQNHSSSYSRGVFRSLFDFKFSSLIAPRVLRFLYALLTILTTIGAVLIFVELVNQGGGRGLAVAVIVIPLYFFLYVIFWRIFVEFMIVFFRMGEDIRAMREQGGGLGAPPAVSLPAPPGSYRQPTAAPQQPVAPPAANLPPPPRPAAQIPPQSQFPPPPPPRGY